jgi:hypothetical protein
MRTAADTQSTFYQINLTTGTPTPIGVVAAGEPGSSRSICTSGRACCSG